ncbi:MAG TPA: ATP synthase F1 subunit epsilon [Candidatus Saccharimonadaceae bacterium]|nr:ATP synthase F1 subunit epsilon [Candidatus Saccharimonadaceae bacterium]|tara:strand:- start:320 stop:742 length:423 start_codon:yes stop_codon:yes gene_type:complete
MHLQLITLHGVRVDQEIYELIAPTSTGEIAIFPGHEPLVTLAVPGALAVRHKKEDRDESLEYFAISGGVLEIAQKSIRVLVDEADHGEDIIEAESRAALERAIKQRDESEDQVEIDKAMELIDRHQVRLRVADLQRRKRR